MEEKKKNIKVFSTQSCPWCVRLKMYLQNNGITFEDIDVSRDQDQARKMVMRSGQMGVPQMWIDNEVIVGFDKTRIDMILGTK